MIAEQYHNHGIKDLEKLATRQLMALRDATYKSSELDEEFNQRQASLRGRVKEILVTREHVPNKKEAKAIRQAAAKR